jgi:hypothetical protein
VTSKKRRQPCWLGATPRFLERLKPSLQLAVNSGSPGRAAQASAPRCQCYCPSLAQSNRQDSTKLNASTPFELRTNRRRRRPTRSFQSPHKSPLRLRCSLLHVQRRQLPHPLAQFLKLMSIHHGAPPPLNTNASHSITDRTAARCTPHDAGAGTARRPRKRSNRSLNCKSGGCHSSSCRAPRSAAPYCSGACDTAHSPSKDALHVWRLRLKHQKNDCVAEQDSGTAHEFALLQATRLTRKRSNMQCQSVGQSAEIATDCNRKQSLRVAHVVSWRQ